MNVHLNPAIRRRDLLRVVAAGAGVATTSTVPLVAAAAKSENAAKDRKARYQANSPEVQTYYRVNRYPAK